MKLKIALFSFVYFLPIASILFGIWYFLADGILYYCTDNIPVSNFVPPFVHPEYGDYFIASPFAVYLLWLVFILVGVVAPYFLASKTVREGVSQASSKLHKHGRHGE